MKMRIAFILMFLVQVNSSSSQTFDWWRDMVGWDGYTHWSNYMNFSPGYLGPNALPVPRIGNGSIDSTNSFSVSGNVHLGKGDRTVNPTLYGNYVLVKNRISLDAFWVPVEFFKVSHELKEERRVYYQSYNHKTAIGDINLNININLLNKIRKDLKLAFRLGYRYPSSSGDGAARMTDAPGYFFDLSAARHFASGSALKWMGMIGFYVWQNNNFKYRQDDAFLFGGGLEYNKPGIRIQSNIAGYLGYVENGDDPVLFRTSLETTGKRTGFIFQFQHGLQDFIYTSFESGIKYHFNFRSGKNMVLEK